MRAHRVLPLTMLVALGFAPTAAAAGHGGDRDYGEGRVQVKTIARGLDSPRHLAFGDRGDLYVAEAGRGSGGTTPCLASAEGPGCFGATGAVTKIDRHGRQYRIASGLASLANIGPGAPAGSNGIGPHGIFVTRDDRLLITNGGPTAPTTLVTPPATGTPLTREDLADINPAASQFGKVYEIGDHGRRTQLADIWDYERDFNPDAQVANPEVDSNAVDLLEDGNRLVVADAGGNALDTVDRYGRVETLTLFENGPAVPPPFPAPPIPPQAVPTSVVKGPDGFYYVSQLVGFPFPTGAANIYRVNPTTGAKTVFASGFTHLMDLAFDRDGTLYALSIDADGLLTPETDQGALWAVPRMGKPRQIALPDDALPFPGGLTIDDGDFYVSINAGSPGGGKVIRIHRRGH